MANAPEHHGLHANNCLHFCACTAPIRRGGSRVSASRGPAAACILCVDALAAGAKAHYLWLLFVLYSGHLLAAAALQTAPRINGAGALTCSGS